jgi:hypothetical protein
VWTVLLSCAWVSQAEYQRYLDPDEDGSPLGEDCGPDDALVYPGAPDLRGDGCDTDCGAERDRDGDDWPDVQDCRPADPLGYPCSPWEVDGDGVDLDCDDEDGVRADVCSALDPNWPADAPIAACPTVTTPTTPEPPPEGAGGIWDGQCTTPDAVAKATMELQDDDGVLQGSVIVDVEATDGAFHGLFPLTGSRDGASVDLDIHDLQSFGVPEARLELVLAGDTLTGTVVPSYPPVPCAFLRE